MAIQTQYPYVDNEGNTYENLIKTYSNNNKKIIQLETGNIYDEAVDIFPSRFTYEETEYSIESEETNNV